MEAYRDKIQLCREGVRKAKAKLELNLSRDEKNNKRSPTDILSKTQRSETLIKNAGKLVSREKEKAEVINNIFVSVLNGNVFSHVSQVDVQQY